MIDYFLACGIDLSTYNVAGIWFVYTNQTSILHRSHLFE